MFAVIGRVKIRPGQEEATLAMIGESGVAMVQAMARSEGGYWARTLANDGTEQHSFWLFDSEENARTAEATFSRLRDMPDAPATDQVQVFIHEVADDNWGKAGRLALSAEGECSRASGQVGSRASST